MSKVDTKFLQERWFCSSTPTNLWAGRVTIRVSGGSKGSKPSHFGFHAVWLSIACERCTSSTHPRSLHTISVSTWGICPLTRTEGDGKRTVLIVVWGVELELIWAGVGGGRAVPWAAVGTLLLVWEEDVACHAPEDQARGKFWWSISDDARKIPCCVYSRWRVRKPMRSTHILFQRLHRPSFCSSTAVVLFL